MSAPRCGQVGDRLGDDALLLWANTHLAQRGRRIDTFETAFCDGVNLLLLLDVLKSDSGSTTPLGEINLQPKLEFHRCGLMRFLIAHRSRFHRMALCRAENCQQGLDFIGKEGIKLVNIGSMDLVRGNAKLVAALVNELCSHYHLGGRSVSEESSQLLTWIQHQIPECSINGFSERQWADGNAVSALIHALAPRSELPHKNCQWSEVTAAANELLGIPVLGDAAELLADENKLVLYLAYFRNCGSDEWRAKLARQSIDTEVKRMAREHEQALPQEPVAAVAEQFDRFEYQQQGGCVTSEEAVRWTRLATCAVPVPMWQGRAQSRRRCGRGEPSLGADVAGASPVPVQI